MFCPMQNIPEDGARAGDEFPGFLVIVVEAHHVGGQQVGGKLNAVERPVKRTGEGFCQHRLAGSRHVLKQDVPAAAEGSQQQLHCLILADDDLVDILLDVK